MLAATCAWAALVIGESVVALPTLPMPTTPGPDPARVAALASGTGPMLVLPVRNLDPEARNKVWSSEELLDQVVHGRPMLSGTMNPDSMVAGPLYQRFWENPALVALRACERAPAISEERSASLTAGFAELRRLGLREIYAEPAREGPEAVASAWRTCLEDVLGPPVGHAGPLRVYDVPGDAPPADPAGTAATGAP
jgi:hypothetical protein